MDSRSPRSPLRATPVNVTGPRAGTTGKLSLLASPGKSPSGRPRSKLASTPCKATTSPALTAACDVHRQAAADAHATTPSCTGGKPEATGMVPTPYRDLSPLPPPLSRLPSLSSTPLPAGCAPSTSPPTASASAQVAGVPANPQTAPASAAAKPQAGGTPLPFGSPASVAEELSPPMASGPNSKFPELSPAASAGTEGGFPGFTPPAPSGQGLYSGASPFGGQHTVSVTPVQEPLVAAAGERSGATPALPLHASTPFQLTPPPPPLAMLNDLSYTPEMQQQQQMLALAGGSTASPSPLNKDASVSQENPKSATPQTATQPAASPAPDEHPDATTAISCGDADEPAQAQCAPGYLEAAADSRAASTMGQQPVAAGAEDERVPEPLAVQSELSPAIASSDATNRCPAQPPCMEEQPQQQQQQTLRTDNTEGVAAGARESPAPHPVPPELSSHSARVTPVKLPSASKSGQSLASALPLPAEGLQVATAGSAGPAAAQHLAVPAPSRPMASTEHQAADRGWASASPQPEPAPTAAAGAGGLVEAESSAGSDTMAGKHAMGTGPGASAPSPKSGLAPEPSDHCHSEVRASAAALQAGSLAVNSEAVIDGVAAAGAGAPNPEEADAVDVVTSQISGLGPCPADMVHAQGVASGTGQASQIDPVAEGCGQDASCLADMGGAAGRAKAGAPGSPSVGKYWPGGVSPTGPVAAQDRADSGVAGAWCMGNGPSVSGAGPTDQGVARVAAAVTPSCLTHGKARVAAQQRHSSRSDAALPSPSTAKRAPEDQGGAAAGPTSCLAAIKGWASDAVPEGSVGGDIEGVREGVAATPAHANKARHAAAVAMTAPAHGHRTTSGEVEPMAQTVVRKSDRRLAGAGVAATAMKARKPSRAAAPATATKAGLPPPPGTVVKRRPSMPAALGTVAKASGPGPSLAPGTAMKAAVPCTSDMFGSPWVNGASHSPRGQGVHCNDDDQTAGQAQAEGQGRARLDLDQGMFGGPASLGSEGAAFVGSVVQGLAPAASDTNPQAWGLEGHGSQPSMAGAQANEEQQRCHAVADTEACEAASVGDTRCLSEGGPAAQAPGPHTTSVAAAPVATPGVLPQALGVGSGSCCKPAGGPAAATMGPRQSVSLTGHTPAAIAPAEGALTATKACATDAAASALRPSTRNTRGGAAAAAPGSVPRPRSALAGASPQAVTLGKRSLAACGSAVKGGAAAAVGRTQLTAGKGVANDEDDSRRGVQTEGRPARRRAVKKAAERQTGGARTAHREGGALQVGQDCSPAPAAATMTVSAGAETALPTPAAALVPAVLGDGPAVLPARSGLADDATEGGVIDRSDAVATGGSGGNPGGAASAAVHAGRVMEECNTRESGPVLGVESGAQGARPAVPAASLIVLPLQPDKLAEPIRHAQAADGSMPLAQPDNTFSSVSAVDALGPMANTDKPSEQQQAAARPCASEPQRKAVAAGASQDASAVTGRRGRRGGDAAQSAAVGPVPAGQCKRQPLGTLAEGQVPSVNAAAGHEGQAPSVNAVAGHEGQALSVNEVAGHGGQAPSVNAAAGHGGQALSVNAVAGHGGRADLQKGQGVRTRRGEGTGALVSLAEEQCVGLQDQARCDEQAGPRADGRPKSRPKRRKRRNASQRVAASRGEAVLTRDPEELPVPQQAETQQGGVGLGEGEAERQQQLQQTTAKRARRDDAPLQLTAVAEAGDAEALPSKAAAGFSQGVAAGVGVTGTAAQATCTKGKSGASTVVDGGARLTRRSARQAQAPQAAGPGEPARTAGNSAGEGMQVASAQEPAAAVCAEARGQTEPQAVEQLVPAAPLATEVANTKAMLPAPLVSAAPGKRPKRGASKAGQAADEGLAQKQQQVPERAQGESKADRTQVADAGAEASSADERGEGDGARASAAPRTVRSRRHAEAVQPAPAEPSSVQTRRSQRLRGGEAQGAPVAEGGAVHQPKGLLGPQAPGSQPEVSGRCSRRVASRENGKGEAGGPAEGEPETVAPKKARRGATRVAAELAEATPRAVPAGDSDAAEQKDKGRTTRQRKGGRACKVQAEEAAAESVEVGAAASLPPKLPASGKRASRQSDRLQGDRSMEDQPQAGPAPGRVTRRQAAAADSGVAVPEAAVDEGGKRQRKSRKGEASGQGDAGGMQAEARTSKRARRAA